MNQVIKVEVDEELKDIMEPFLSQIRKDTAQLEKSFQDKIAEVIRFAHKLRGNAPGYGLKELGALGGKLEDAGKAGRHETCWEMFQEIKTYTDNLQIKYVKDLGW